MARPRPSLSITLPTNFEFHYSDGQLPKTPEPPEEPQEQLNPPPPPRQTYKVKRKRAAVPFQEPNIIDSDTPIPTIEMSEAASTTSSPVTRPSRSPNGFLAPLPTMQRFTTPPKTPATQIDPYLSVASPAQEWGLINDSRKSPFGRAGSVCSDFSDSSLSSYGSSGFSAPLESCTSPESEGADPFMEEDVLMGEKGLLPSVMSENYPRPKRVKGNGDQVWTLEMDQHLETTYIMYLQDPRVTPFKTLPGVAPPLGVCSRVASKARHTWNKHRSSTPLSLNAILESTESQRAGSPDTIRPKKTTTRDARQPSWPRSDAATRRRLKKLVKSKPALSAHYQRLLRTRSPSPFTSSSSINRSSEPPVSAFSGKDMRMSLITATAPSMHPEGPLAQLTSDDGKNENSIRPQSQREARPSNWFSRIGRSQARHTSLSLQTNLTIDTENNQPAPPLRSPFEDDANRSHLLHSMETTKSLGRHQFSRKDGKALSLDSPFDVQPVGAPTMPRSRKRRFKSDEEKPRRGALEDVFGPAIQDSIGIVRNRGFTVGAVRATDSLSKLSAPTPAPPQLVLAPPSTPSSSDHEMSEAPAFPLSSSGGCPSSSTPLFPVGSNSAPRRLAEPIPRLGSPFMEGVSGGSGSARNNTFPRSYIPTVGNPQPFQQRLQELIADKLPEGR